MCIERMGCSCEGGMVARGAAAAVVEGIGVLIEIREV